MTFVTSQSRTVELRVNGRWRRYPTIADAARRNGIERKTLSLRLQRGDPSCRYVGESQLDAELRLIGLAAAREAEAARSRERRRQARAGASVDRTAERQSALRALAGYHALADKLGCKVSEVYAR